MKMEILELLIRLAVLVMAGIVIPAFRRWLNARTDNERLNKIRSWVYDAVYAAEQIYNHTEKLDPDGSKRKKYVHNAVMTEDSEEHDDGKISKVLQKGYKLNDKVIRPSMVAVVRK